MMPSRIFTRLLPLLGLLLLAQPLQAEEQTLVLYSKLSAPTVLDVDPVGLSVGDMITREGTKLASPDGPPIADYFSQAIVTLYDPETDRSVRSYFIETIFEEGSIYMMDLVEFDHGTSVADGHSHEGAFVGGTGAYHGITGSYRLTIKDGLSTKTLRYSLP